MYAKIGHVKTSANMRQETNGSKVCIRKQMPRGRYRISLHLQKLPVDELGTSVSYKVTFIPIKQGKQVTIRQKTIVPFASSRFY